MNPQDPQQQYGQPSYTPQTPAQVPQPNQVGSSFLPAASVSDPLPNATTNGHNPYEFILNPDASHHKAPVGNSLVGRMLAIVGVVVALTIIGAVAYKLFLPKDNSTQQITAIAQEQQELVRVASFVASHAGSTNLVNFAVNTQMSVSTNQQAAIAYAATRGVKLESKVLILKQDAATDKLFASAISTNTFDTTAAQTLNTQLSTYQANLKRAYSVTSGKKAQAVLQSSYDTAATLATQGASLK